LLWSETETVWAPWIAEATAVIPSAPTTSGAESHGALLLPSAPA
jgi:hypothetical protein